MREIAVKKIVVRVGIVCGLFVCAWLAINAKLSQERAALDAKLQGIEAREQQLQVNQARLTRAGSETDCKTQNRNDCPPTTTVVGPAAAEIVEDQERPPGADPLLNLFSANRGETGDSGRVEYVKSRIKKLDYVELEVSDCECHGPVCEIYAVRKGGADNSEMGAVLALGSIFSQIDFIRSDGDEPTTVHVFGKLAAN